MSRCGNCPLDGGQRIMCCGETERQAAARLGVTEAALKVRIDCARNPLYALGVYHPGQYDSRCSQCGNTFSGADKMCFCCHPCAMKAAGVEPLPPKRQPPKLGETIKFRHQGRVHTGVVVREDDPSKSGTYNSTEFGVIHLRYDLSNRAARRKQAAQNRQR